MGGGEGAVEEKLLTSRDEILCSPSVLTVMPIETDRQRETDNKTLRQTEKERHKWKCPTVTRKMCKSCREGD